MIITIARECGCNGDDIGRFLAEKYNVPIIMDLDIGHTAPMMPIVSGAKAEIVVEKNSIKIHYKELEV